MSKAAFIQQRFREWGSPSSPEARKPALSFEAIKAQFQQKQSSDLQAQNARVQAVINRLNLKVKEVQSSPEYIALIKEASLIQQSYAHASGEEQSRLKSRALEIDQRLARLDRID